MKKYAVFYLDEVKNDLLFAKQWYAREEVGLDERKKQIIITGIVHNKRSDAVSLDR
jgi:hypothetical protein